MFPSVAISDPASMAKNLLTFDSSISIMAELFYLKIRDTSIWSFGNQ